MSGRDPESVPVTARPVHPPPVDGEEPGPAGEWAPHERRESDHVTLFPALGMAALLDRTPAGIESGTPLPWGWHWLYFKPVTPQSELGYDGHARRGDFLPPLSLPRRMWAGGTLRFFRPLKVGEAAERVSTVRSVTPKEGRSGRLAFVTVEHVISGPDGLACEEEQNLVYREAAKDTAAPAPSTPFEGRADWEESFLPTSSLLFRFSALTFNAHRIHYDREYATEREGYPGLVVHGPLLALLLLDAGIRRTPDREAATYGYRAVAPAFVDEAVTIVGEAEEDGSALALYALNRGGNVITQATLEWRR